MVSERCSLVLLINFVTNIRVIVPKDLVLMHLASYTGWKHNIHSGTRKGFLCTTSWTLQDCRWDYSNQIGNVD